MRCDATYFPLKKNYTLRSDGSFFPFKRNFTLRNDSSYLPLKKIIRSEAMPHTKYFALKKQILRSEPMRRFFLLKEFYAPKGFFIFTLKKNSMLRSYGLFFRFKRNSSLRSDSSYFPLKTKFYAQKQCVIFSF